MLDPTKMQRLAFIKYMFRIGIQQSSNAEPFSGAALLTFHDSVELFLQLASEELGAEASKTFMDYWPSLSARLPAEVELSQAESMRRLNKSRVSLKHHGTLPSKLDMEAFRATTFSFFEENTRAIFGIDFDQISLTEFVQPEGAKKRIISAQKFLEAGDIKNAISEVAVSFHEMIDDYSSRKKTRANRSPFYFGRSLNFHNSFFMGLDRGPDRKLAEFVDRVAESIEYMQSAIKVLALGLDYRKYSKFQMLTPYTVRTMDGKYHIEHDSTSGLPLPEDVGFCIDFVIEAAVHLRDFDYDVVPAQTQN
jgi:hypothetical protein